MKGMSLFPRGDSDRKMLREGTAREGTARDTYSKYDKPDQVRMHLHGLLLSVPVMFEVCETRCK